MYSVKEFMYSHGYECVCLFCFFNDTATTEIYTLSLHDALPISPACPQGLIQPPFSPMPTRKVSDDLSREALGLRGLTRSEEHTSELQSRQYLVCRLLLEKKKHYTYQQMSQHLHSLLSFSQLHTS